MDGIIFDVDGTLWDSTASVAVAYNDAMKEFGYDLRVDADRLKKEFGKPMDVIFRNLLPGTAPEECTRIADRSMALEEEYLLTDPEERIQSMLYQDIEKMLALLSGKYPLFIVSNCQCGYIELFLKRTGFGKYIKAHLCFGETGTSKGQTILRLMKEQGVKDPVYVGDIQGDFDASKEAGIQFVHAAYGFGKVKDPDYVINEPMDLTKLFD